MKNPAIKKSTFDFLRMLATHNDRNWFEANRARYEASKENIETFVDGLILKMNAHDDLETPSAKKSLYRIFNDVRFSKDKSPYNPRFAGYLKRRKPDLRGGYYFWIRPGGTMIGCGFAYPNSQDLTRIRQDIDLNDNEWRKLLKTRSIVGTFGAMQGEQVKTAPRGFASDHPAIDLLRYKQFWFERKFSDREALSENFLQHMNKSFKAIRPFFDYMSEVLTTDLNGEKL